MAPHFLEITFSPIFELRFGLLKSLRTNQVGESLSVIVFPNADPIIRDSRT